MARFPFAGSTINSLAYVMQPPEDRSSPEEASGPGESAEAADSGMAPWEIPSGDGGDDAARKDGGSDEVPAEESRVVPVIKLSQGEDEDVRVEPTGDILTVYCPSCGHALFVNDSDLGIKGRCLNCATPITAIRSKESGAVFAKLLSSDTSPLAVDPDSLKEGVFSGGDEAPPTEVPPPTPVSISASAGTTTEDGGDGAVPWAGAGGGGHSSGAGSPAPAAAAPAAAGGESSDALDAWLAKATSAGDAGAPGEAASLAASAPPAAAGPPAPAPAAPPSPPPPSPPPPGPPGAARGVEGANPDSLGYVGGGKPRGGLLRKLVRVAVFVLFMGALLGVAMYLLPGLRPDSFESAFETSLREGQRQILAEEWDSQRLLAPLRGEELVELEPIEDPEGIEAIATPPADAPDLAAVPEDPEMKAMYERGQQVLEDFYAAITPEEKAGFTVEPAASLPAIRAFYPDPKALPELERAEFRTRQVDAASGKAYGVFLVREAGDRRIHLWTVLEAEPGNFRLDWELYEQLANRSLQRFLADPTAPPTVLRLVFSRRQAVPPQASPFGQESVSYQIQMIFDGEVATIQVPLSQSQALGMEQEIGAENSRVCEVELSWVATTPLPPGTEVEPTPAAEASQPPAEADDGAAADSTETAAGEDDTSTEAAPASVAPDAVVQPLEFPATVPTVTRILRWGTW